VKNIRNLVFDLDGTLIDSSVGIVECVNYSLRMMNQPEQPADVIRPYIGYQLGDMYADFTDAPLDELMAHFRERALEVIVASTVALPGADALLEQLRQSEYTLAIASTKIKLHIGGIVDKLGWRDYFVALVGGDDVAAQKPAPDAFIEAMRRMNCPAHQTLAVGDTINDILAAKAVPMKVCAVVSPYEDRAKVEAVGPDIWIEHLEELPRLLNGHSASNLDESNNHNSST
jgi:phosphoglycolate phosphatase